MCPQFLRALNEGKIADICLRLLFYYVNPYNFHKLEIVSVYRDTKLKAGENYSYLYNLKPSI